MSHYAPSEESLDIYLNELRDMPELEPEEVVELGRLARKGDMDARRLLILGHLRYVVSVAKRHNGGGLPLSDLVCWGNLGLLYAVEGYDPDYKQDSNQIKDDNGGRDPGMFTTYSKWYIEKYIREAIKAWQGRQSKKDYGPTDEIPDVYGKMAEFLCIDLNSKDRRKNTKIEPFVWLDDLLLDKVIASGEKDGATYESLIPSSEPDPSVILSDDDARRDLQKIIDQTLSKDERMYLELYFGYYGKPMEEWDIARVCSVNVLKVAKTINNAIVRLNKNQLIRELRGCISK